MKPVTYFIQDESINKLVERFGCYFEKLDRSQKIQIRLLLTNFLLGQEMMGEDYSIGDAWEDSSLHLLTSDNDVITVADILIELTIVQAEGLLAALQEQCTFLDATIQNLTEYGVPYQVAVTGASILNEVDGVRDCTPQEQEILTQMYHLVIAHAKAKEMSNG